MRLFWILQSTIVLLFFRPGLTNPVINHWQRGAVKILYQRIYPSLREKTYYHLNELNKAIWKELEVHNDKKLSGRPSSRKQLFIEDEKHKLSKLPQERYEIKLLSFATVMQNGHVMLAKDKHY